MKNISRYLGIIGVFLLLAGALGLGMAPMFKGFHYIPWTLALICLVIYAVYHKSDIKAFLTRRSTRYGAGSALATVLVVGILVFLAVMTNTHVKRFDLTASQRYSLAPQTVKILKNLDQDIKAVGFFQPEGEERRKARDLLEQYALQSKKFTFELLDPDRNPARAKAAGVTRYDTIVLEAGPNTEKITTVSEERLTNGILKVTRPEKKIIYVLTGHGEKDLDQTDPQGYSQVKTELDAQNYEVKPLLLMQSASVPEDAAELIVAGPQKDLMPEEIQAIEKYLDGGGKILAMIDPETAPGFSAFWEKYGVRVGNDYIVDKMSRLFGGDYLMPLVAEYISHPVTKDFNVATFFPLARSVSVIKKDEKSMDVTTLAQTGQDAWGETDLEQLKKGTAEFNQDQDEPGPVSVAVAGTVAVAADGTGNGKEDAAKPAEATPEQSERKGRFIVIGDSNFVDNKYIGLQGNSDLFLNTVSWLAEQDDQVAIRAKEAKFQPLMISAIQARLLFWLPVVVMPLLVLMIGVLVLAGRRRRQ